MSLPTQFVPMHKSELVGNKKAFNTAEDAVLSGKTAILYGPAGVGKTSFVHAVANDMGWQVREWNASDSRKRENFEQILRELRNRPFTSTLYFLDETDGCDDFKGLENCIKNSKNPLVLACNDLYAIPKFVTDLCEKIQFYPPTVAEVSQVIRRIEQASGMKADYSRISHDIRNSILNCFYGSSSYHSQTIFEEVEEYFKTGNTKQLTSDHYIWLLDNGCAQFKGRKMFEFYNLLDVCDRIGNFKPLSIIKGGKEKIEYPRFIKRAKVLRGKKDVET